MNLLAGGGDEGVHLHVGDDDVLQVDEQEVYRNFDFLSRTLRLTKLIQIISP